MGKKITNIDDVWGNTIAFNSYFKENPDCEYIYVKRKKKYYIKMKILQNVYRNFKYQTFYIDPRDFLK